MKYLGLTIISASLFAFGLPGLVQAESMEIKQGTNTGVNLPIETKALADGSNYMALGSKWIVTTELAGAVTAQIVSFLGALEAGA